MKRQLETNEHEPKDWGVNCINLAEYFLENNHFSQAEYCLHAGLLVIPEETKDVSLLELRASLQMQLGRFYGYRLRQGVEMY